jgi:hypothetical protein
VRAPVDRVVDRGGSIAGDHSALGQTPRSGSAAEHPR